MADTARTIWDTLVAVGMTPAGAAGLMGNLYAESALKSTNLQQSAEKRLGLTDEQYTAAVDDGSYAAFPSDRAGYGLAQWTYKARKQGMLIFARTCGKSIGDLSMQVAFLVKELQTDYQPLWQLLTTTDDVQAASDAVLMRYEQPRDQSDAVKATRAGYGQKYYTIYHAAAPSGGMTEEEARGHIIGVMQAWIGRREADGSHRHIIDIYNGRTPRARGYKVTYADAWCATTVSAAAIQSEQDTGLPYTKIIPLECGCEEQIKLLQRLGAWQERDDYVPTPGDIIYYDWQDTGAGDCSGHADHVGIVETVRGRDITVIEGNYSDSVKRRTISIGARCIRGYGVPDYKKIATAASEKPLQSDKPAPALTVTKTEPAVMPASDFKKNMAGRYTVTASALNVRGGPGKIYHVLKVIKRGATVRCYGYYTDVPGGRWLLVQLSDGSTGHLSSTYVKRS